jgi:hypothetical protein
LVPVSAPDAAPTLADLDGDGDLDLFVGTGQAGIYTPFGGIRFYENTGTPEVYNYQLITDNYFCIDCGWKTTPRLIDIDADGDLDLFVGYSSGGIAFFRNTGTVEAPYFILEEEWFQQLSGGSHCSPDFADLDGDGDYDLLIGYEDINSQAKVKYFENIGSPETPIFVLISTDYLPGLPDLSARPASCDIDFDGDIDIFVSTWYVEGVFFYCNIGTPISPRFQLESQNYQDLPTGNLYFWDLDGDTDYDLFMGYGTNIRYYENIGSPYGANFELISENWENLNIHSPYAYPCISDIDNDSDGDLFIGSEDGGVVFYRNQYYNNSISNNYINNPKTFILQQPYPNPFNPSTTLCFTLDEASPVKLSVYNQLGQEVTTIINNQMSPGSYRFNWDASNYSSGVYLISLESNLGIQQTQKVILVK